MANVFDLQIGCVTGGMPLTSGSFNNQVASASTTKIGWVFQAASLEPITHFGFRYGVRTGTPPTFIGGIQGVDATCLPSGTYKGGGSPASATFTPPASAAWDGTWQYVALANSYTPAAIGELLAIVIEYSSGTIDGSNNSSFTYGQVNVGYANRGSAPYSLTNTGSWAKVTGNNYPVYGCKGASNAFGYPLLTLGASGTVVSVNGNRAAMKFMLPSGAGTSIAVSTITACVQTPTAGGNNWIFGIWDATGAVVQTVTLDSDYCTTQNSQVRIAVARFATPATLTDGTQYYAGIERSGTNIALNTLDFSNANDLTAITGGSGLILSTWNGSAWSDTATSRPLVELVLSDMTASGGGTTAVNINCPVIIPPYRVSGY